MPRAAGQTGIRSRPSGPSSVSILRECEVQRPRGQPAPAEWIGVPAAAGTPAVAIVAAGPPRRGVLQFDTPSPCGRGKCLQVGLEEWSKLKNDAPAARQLS